VPLRTPSDPWPQWLGDIIKGNYEHLDSLIEQFDLEHYPLRPTLEDALESVKPNCKPERELEKASRAVDFGFSSKVPLASEALHVIPDVPKKAHNGFLKLEAVKALAVSNKAHFLLRRFDARNPKWKPSRPGALDLYSGSRRHAKALLRRGAPWVLFFDSKHGDGHDLLDAAVRARVGNAVRNGCFATGAAGPPCSFFSSAVTPPVRNPCYPQGVPWASEAMKEKMAIGNSHSLWLASLVKGSRRYMMWWIENPDSSGLWRMPECVQLGKCMFLFRVDCCRYGTPYRKRTRFMTNIPHLKCDPILCKRDHVHTVLRGTHPSGRLWTQVAEPYPFPPSDHLAMAAAIDCNWHPEVRVDVDSIPRRQCVC